MRNRDVQIALVDCTNVIDNWNKDKVDELARDFNVPIDASNAETSNAHDFHIAMIEYQLLAKQNKHVGSLFDAAKKKMDSLLTDMNRSNEAIADTTVELYADGDMAFKKKQNKTGSQLVVTDLLTALAKAGVDQDIVDKAVSDATKDKRGNTYYIVEPVG
jgi:hypothetical protein